MSHRWHSRRMTNRILHNCWHNSRMTSRIRRHSKRSRRKTNPHHTNITQRDISRSRRNS